MANIDKAAVKLKIKELRAEQREVGKIIRALDKEATKADKKWDSLQGRIAKLEAKLEA